MRKSKKKENVNMKLRQKRERFELAIIEHEGKNIPVLAKRKAYVDKWTICKSFDADVSGVIYDKSQVVDSIALTDATPERNIVEFANTKIAKALWLTDATEELRRQLPNEKAEEELTKRMESIIAEIRNAIDSQEMNSAQAKASAKYDKANTKGVYLKLNTKTDSDIINRLDQVDNKQGYIKELIKADIEKGTE